MTSKKKQRTKDDAESEVDKKEVTAYKYSKKGLGSLYEAIILQGEPRFVTWFQHNGTKAIKENIEETTRVIRPPNAEEYPYTPYEFADESELNDYFSRANTINSRAELYQIAKGFFGKYVDQDKNIIVVLSADSILTYFQDLFPIIHYSEGIGGNDVGKSSIGYTFEYTGYRVIRGTSISGANYFRILGSIEPGQCTIIEDEGDSISEDQDKVRILKSGYEYNAKIPKTNMNTQKQEQNWFYPFCYKMILAEKSLSEWKAKGLADRTFTFKCRPGKVNYSIKKVVSETINKSLHLQKLYNELLDFRKLMLCYRLIHYEDELKQIKVNLINRDEELSFPLLQLFYGTEVFDEIKTALEFFIKQRRERRHRSLEAAIYPILKGLIDENTNFTTSNPKLVNIEYSEIWNKITSGDGRPIKGNLFSENQYETHEYDPLYQNTLSVFIGDKFSADLKHKEGGSVLTFDTEKFDTYYDVYNHQVEGQESDLTIEVSLMEPEDEGSEGTDGSSDGFDNYNENTNLSPKPSDPSESSAFPPKCYYCDLHDFESKSDYESHILFRHPKKPGYPNSADIGALNLVPQMMNWETEATK